MLKVNDLNDTAARFTHKTEAIIVFLLISIVLVFQCYWKTKGIAFKSFTESDVLAIITSMFVIAVFMERSVDAILTPVRSPDLQKIEQELEDIRSAAETVDSLKDEQRAKERELDMYKLATSRYAYWISFVFGLAISLVGVRTLGSLVDLKELNALGDTQRNLFSAVDIILTGGVIAGGSAAIDKIGSGLSGYFNLKSATDLKPPIQSGK